MATSSQTLLRILPTLRTYLADLPAISSVTVMSIGNAVSTLRALPSLISEPFTLILSFEVAVRRIVSSWRKAAAGTRVIISSDTSAVMSSVMRPELSSAAIVTPRSSAVKSFGTTIRV